MVADDLQQVVVPFLGADDALVLGGGPDDPVTLLLVDAAGVPAERAIDLELRTLGYVRRPLLEPDVEEHPAVAIPLALESQRELEVLIAFVGLQVAVLLGDGEAMQRSVLDFPFLLPDVFPT